MKACGTERLEGSSGEGLVQVGWKHYQFSWPSGKGKLRSRTSPCTMHALLASVRGPPALARFEGASWLNSAGWTRDRYCFDGLTVNVCAAPSRDEHRKFGKECQKHGTEHDER